MTDCPPPLYDEQQPSLSVTDIYNDLGSLHEVAEALGVSIFRVRRWIERRYTTGCPRPVRELRSIHIYSIADWHGWFALWKVTRGSETWAKRQVRAAKDDPQEPPCGR